MQKIVVLIFLEVSQNVTRNIPCHEVEEAFAARRGQNGVTTDSREDYFALLPSSAA